jgi:Family of unknown function (DUF5522)
VDRRPAEQPLTRLSRRPLSEPHPDRLAPDHPSRTRILAAHDAASASGQPGYPDPLTGLFVFTAATLAATGKCCRSGCRHCPFLPVRGERRQADRPT